jgi:ATP-dependent DNA helicase RecQ
VTLRAPRREIIAQRNVPDFVLFSDASLRDMSRLRPSTPSALLSVRGVGEKKVADLGQRFIEEIVTYCRENRLALDT